MIKLFENAMDLREVDNNVKADNIREIIGSSFQELGTGTNRIALMKDGYVFKVALDRRGMIDNLAEYKRSAEAPMYLAKCYETNRCVAISEYVNLISADEYVQNKDKLRFILSELTSKYVIKDLGLTPKNYCNWGYRDDGSIVALDYAYMYPIAGNEEALRCSCGGIIELDSTFTTYKCNNKECGLVYSAMEILNKMDIDSERTDDEAVFKEAGVDLSEVEGQFGDEFTNFIKITNDYQPNSPDDAIVTRVPPLHTSPLADVAKKIMTESKDNDFTKLSYKDELDVLDNPDFVTPNDDDITEEEWEEALTRFEQKKLENNN
jgi:hypothetical protein